MSLSLTIALAQVKVAREKQINLETAQRCIAKAASSGADLVIFPEMFMVCPQKGIPLATEAEPLDGEFVTALAALAKQYGVAVMSGVWEQIPGEEERAGNVVVVLDRNGEMVARYHKIHLFNALSVRESDQMVGGDQVPDLFELNGIRIGMAICYDLRFPEIFRYHAKSNADLVVVPAAWYSGPLKEDHWLTLLRARAIENTMYVAGIDLCGKAFSGRSVCFDPFGVPLTDAGEGENVVIARIERERVSAIRDQLPCLKHIRDDLF